MAGRVPAAVKERLKAADRWDDFNHYRMELKEAGYSATAATRKATEKYDTGLEDCGPPDDAELVTGDGRLPRAPAGLEGKQATEPEIVRWVARNIDSPAPSVEECPDPFAWTLLRQCRKNDEFVRYFTDKLWAKLIPSRSQLDASGPADIDGKVTMDLIKKIQAMSEEAKSDAS